MHITSRFRHSITVGTGLLSCVFIGCGQDAGSESGPGILGGMLMAVMADTDPADAATADTDNVASPAAGATTNASNSMRMDPTTSDDALNPAQYCETTADMFCGFYLRCNRIAADAEADCRNLFLETCNARFEPIYVSLVETGSLTLSATGVDACRSHLSQVDCNQQVFDLDGGCAGMWVGAGAQGTACGVGIESFVCRPGLSCEINTSLCGECRVRATPNQACTTNGDCPGPFSCVNGGCVGRGRPGDICHTQAPCAVGTRCEDGRCANFIRARVGEACDQVRRCPYGAVCVDGQCVRAAALGEACTPQVGCVSGYCVDICQPLKALGAPCDSPGQCAHNRCTNGRCGPTTSTCLDP
ncbi:MAG: hypothetical protein VX589_05780 [Myxococcota bacterium]|nr:hypothetical protein [Myxococcota bacterium]